MSGWERFDGERMSGWERFDGERMSGWEREREFEGERMSGCERKKSKDILVEKRESLLINAQKINRAYDHTEP